MAGTSTPTLDSIAKAIAARVKSVQGMSAEVVHDRQRLILTREGWVSVGYDFGTKTVRYWEVVGPLSNNDVEQPFRDYFVNENEFALQGIRSFRDGPDDDDNSSKAWRGELEAIQNALRAEPTVFGAPTERPTLANRGARLANNVLQLVDGVGLCHVAQFLIPAEQITQLPE